MNSHRQMTRLAGLCALVALAATAAACSNSPSGSGPPSGPSASSSPSAPMTASPAASSSASGSAGGAAAVAANWEAFFNAKTPVSKRVMLLQEGSLFEPIIKSQAGSGLAALATAKVTHVTITSPTQATVKYEILVSGTPELKNQTGIAVLENGTWKVGVKSFCGLLIIENAGKTSGLPAACTSAT